MNLYEATIATSNAGYHVGIEVGTGSSGQSQCILSMKDPFTTEHKVVASAQLYAAELDAMIASLQAARVLIR